MEVKSLLDVVFKHYSYREMLRTELEEDVGFLVRHLPGVVGVLLRYFFYKLLFAEIKSVPIIAPGVRFVGMKKIRLGKGVCVNSNTYINGKGCVELGDNVVVATNCSIISEEHGTYLDSPIVIQPTTPKKVIIEPDCWLGTNVIVLAGVTLGKGSVIGAGSVVTKSTEPYSINVGVPARKIGTREKKKGGTEGIV